MFVRNLLCDKLDLELERRNYIKKKFTLDRFFYLA